MTWELSLVQGWVGESGLPECEGFGRSATENETPACSIGVCALGHALF